MLLKRLLENTVLESLEHYPAVALVGPRQVGKTTLAKEIIAKYNKKTIYIDLESIADLQKLTDAEQYLEQRDHYLIVIDEIQREPSLFPLLRSLIDKNRQNGRFILLGSASPELLAKSSETLAGRIAYIEVQPFVYEEVKNYDTFRNLWLKGGFPNMFLQKKIHISFDNRSQFIQTYIERELPLLGLSASPTLLRNLLRMLASVNGQLLNYSDLSKSLGVNINTVKRYIDYFENAFLVRRLEPYFLNIAKRIVKSPKIYIRDSGILHTLVGIENMEDLEGYAAKGNSWESFVIQQVIAQLRPTIGCHFYRTQDGSELDLVLIKGITPVLGIEMKYSNAPKIEKGNKIAAQDLGNVPLIVVTPSINEDLTLNNNITITSFERLFEHLRKLNLLR